MVWCFIKNVFIISVPVQKRKTIRRFLMINEGSYVNYDLLVRIEVKYPKVKIKVRCAWDSDLKKKKYTLCIVFTFRQYLPRGKALKMNQEEKSCLPWMYQPANRMLSLLKHKQKPSLISSATLYWIINDRSGKMSSGKTRACLHVPLTGLGMSLVKQTHCSVTLTSLT